MNLGPLAKPIGLGQVQSMRGNCAGLPPATMGMLAMHPLKLAETSQE